MVLQRGCIAALTQMDNPSYLPGSAKVLWAPASLLSPSAIGHMTGWMLWDVSCGKLNVDTHASPFCTHFKFETSDLDIAFIVVNLSYQKSTASCAPTSLAGCCFS